MRHQTHWAVWNVTNDLDKGFQFNTAVSWLMQFSNFLEDQKPGNAEEGRAVAFGFKRLLVMLASFAPHLAEELWARSGEKPSIFEAGWPRCDAGAFVRDVVEIVVQVNGRVRGVVRVPAGAAENAVRSRVEEEPKLRDLLAGKTVRRWVLVPDKLVNIVI
jgi:leucyl-tRNA synthetase